MYKNLLRLSVIFILISIISISAQTYACSMLSLSVEKNGVIKKKSYAVTSLYISFSPDSVKIFGNYQGRYISNVFMVNRRNYDTLFVSGGFFGKAATVYLVHRNNYVMSNYNFINDAGESSITVNLSLKPLQNHFSENYHEKKERQQSPSVHRDLLGRDPKK